MKVKPAATHSGPPTHGNKKIGEFFLYVATLKSRKVRGL